MVPSPLRSWHHRQESRLALWIELAAFPKNRSELEPKAELFGRFDSRTAVLKENSTFKSRRSRAEQAAVDYDKWHATNMNEIQSRKPRVSQLELFLAFSRISLSSFGGAI